MDPGPPIQRRILQDLIGSDDPTESYRIPGLGITLDSDGQMSNVTNFMSGLFSNSMEGSFTPIRSDYWKRSDPRDDPIGSTSDGSDIIPRPGILQDFVGLSDSYKSLQIPIRSNIGSDRIRHRIDRPGLKSYRYSAHVALEKLQVPYADSS